tara:strand:+ start:4517 stop:4984 length:468 start_codon:yes stop_codon:yes gene_type:complete
MKKLLLVLALAVCSFTANAQFSLGASVGLPTGDASDITSVAFSVDAAYMLASESDVAFGFTASYLYYSGDDPFPNWSFLPLAGAIRFAASEKFTLGADIGYAIGLNPDGNDGGFFYKPMLGYSIGEATSLNLSFSNVSLDGATVSNFGLGIMFGI